VHPAKGGAQSQAGAKILSSSPAKASARLGRCNCTPVLDKLMQLRGCALSPQRRRADRAKEKELSLISTFKERLDAGHRAPDNDDLFSITASIVRFC
jgi:hypothetical protein